MIQCNKFFLLLIIACLLPLSSVDTLCEQNPSKDLCRDIRGPEESESLDVLEEDLVIEPVVFKQPHPVIIFLQQRAIKAVLAFFAFKERCSRWLKKLRNPFVSRSYDSCSNR